jgi:magnesium-transporting ATPase (P-type)
VARILNILRIPAGSVMAMGDGFNDMGMLAAAGISAAMKEAPLQVQACANFTADGVLDALPLEKEEETMKEIILQVHSQAPRELGRNILERVLAYSDYKVRDDMTVLAAGIWKK